MANFYTPKKRDNLSPLQCCILTLGKKNGGIVLARDVLIEYYGFKPVRDPSCLNAGAIVFKNQISALVDIIQRRLQCARRSIGWFRARLATKYTAASSLFLVRLLANFRTDTRVYAFG
jgi:hypothetical protein